MTGTPTPQDFAAALRDAVGAEAQARHDPPPASLFERAKALASGLPRQPSWLDRAAARIMRPLDEFLAGSPDAPALAPVLRGDDRSVRTYADGRASLDVAVERDSGGAPALRVAFESADEGTGGASDAEFAVLDAASGRVLATTTLTANRQAVVAIAPVEAVDLALRHPSGVLLVEGISLG